MSQCIIIGQDAKDVPASLALDYVAAYTVGNDISSRRLQLDRDLAGPMPQADFSKGFDTFAPLGPALVSTAVITKPGELMLKTTVDGEVRQEGETGDLVFGVEDLVAYLSTGTTLQKGSVIMTGTPGGKPLTLRDLLGRTAAAGKKTKQLRRQRRLTRRCLGVGSRMRPPRWLVPGTKMEVHITGIGTLRNGVSFA